MGGTDPASCRQKAVVMDEGPVGSAAVQCALMVNGQGAGGTDQMMQSPDSVMARSAGNGSRKAKSEVWASRCAAGSAVDV